MMEDAPYICHYMLRLVLRLSKQFARSRMRREMKFEAKLKDLQTQYSVQQQIKTMRMGFQMKAPNELLTTVLKEQKPKLQHRFKIDTKKLNKSIKQEFNKGIDVKQLYQINNENRDLEFLEDKSNLNDQSMEVQFTKKVQHELFVKKETNRLIEKEKHNYKHYLIEGGDVYTDYQHKKEKFKNSRIQSMMAFQRNNEQLQLLIQSGFIDDPESLKVIIDELPKKTLRIQHTPQAQLEHNEESSSSSPRRNIAKEQQTSLVGQLFHNITGVSELRDSEKLDKFLYLYQQSNEKEKQKTEQDLNLLMQIRKFERDLFLSRYDMINYRFKGRVAFDYMDENELLSYLKHSNVTPHDLMLLYDQNKGSLNRFGQPIITPAVISRIYARASVYQFPQTDQNNRINMLNDPAFVRVEKSLFRKLHLINNEYFCDSVWAYAFNHRDEQGVLDRERCKAMQSIIFKEVLERASSLQEKDLGLLMRSMVKLTILADESYRQLWPELLNILDQRLKHMKQSYEFESVMELVSMTPPSELSVTIVARNISTFKYYTWESKATLMANVRVASLLFNHSQLLSEAAKAKSVTQLKQILATKKDEIKPLLSKIPIDFMPYLLTHFQQLQQFQVGPSIPPILLNATKKQIVDHIKTQKQQLKKQTLPYLCLMMGILDYQIHLRKLSIFNITPLRTVVLRQLLPNRVFLYNSINYFIYHELSQLLDAEWEVFHHEKIANSLLGMALVHYKNQGLYDLLTQRVFDAIYNHNRKETRQMLTVSQARTLTTIFNTYSLQRRTCELTFQILSLLQKAKSIFAELQINLLVSFFAAYTNILSLPQKLGILEPQAMKMQRDMLSLFIYCCEYRIGPFFVNLETEEQIALFLSMTMFRANVKTISQEYADMRQKTDYLQEQVHKIGKMMTQKSESLPLAYRYIVALCQQLNVNHQQTQQYAGNNSMISVQQSFYSTNIDRIKENQHNIGVKYPYDVVYKKISTQLATTATKVVEKCWRIQLPEEKKVYFIATFEHILTRKKDKGTSINLFGFWKIYQELYRKNRWEFNLILTFAEG